MPDAVLTWGERHGWRFRLKEVVRGILEFAQRLPGERRGNRQIRFSRGNHVRGGVRLRRRRSRFPVVIGRKCRQVRCLSRNLEVPRATPPVGCAIELGVILSRFGGWLAWDLFLFTAAAAKPVGQRGLFRGGFGKVRQWLRFFS